MKKITDAWLVMLLASLVGVLGIFGTAKAITIQDRWAGDLNVITGVTQDSSNQILTIAEDYNENNLIPYTSEDGNAVVNVFPDPGCPASEGTCWFDKIISVGASDPVGAWDFRFVVTNTTPFRWSDFHFEFYDPTFQNQVGGVLTGAFGASGFLGIGVNHNPDSVQYFAGDLAPGSTTTFRLDLNLTAGQTFGIRQIATTPEPATLALLGLGIAGIGYQRRKQIKA